MNGWTILKVLGIILVIGILIGLVFWPIAIALLWHYGVMSFETAIIVMLTVATIEIMGLRIEQSRDK